MCGFLLILVILLILFLVIGLHQKTTNAICLSRRRLDGKTVLVTGGTAGMGFEIAKDLAHRGAKVIIACPYQEEGNSAKRLIIEETGNENVIFELLDLASLDSVRKFASTLLSVEDRLDILVNNAGVGTPCNTLTSDGMHFIMQVNYYGTFLLTILLLPLLKKTGKLGESSRIVLTSSITHQIGMINLKTINKPNRNVTWYLKYPNSKLCLVLFANELTTKLKNSNVVVNCVDPGAVATRIFYSINKIVGFVLQTSIKYLFKTPWEGAQTTLHVALDKEAGEESGQFYKNCQKTRAVRRAYSENTSKKLWEDSLRLVKLTEEEYVQCFQ